MRDSFIRILDLYKEDVAAFFEFSQVILCNFLELHMRWAGIHTHEPGTGDAGSGPSGIPLGRLNDDHRPDRCLRYAATCITNKRAIALCPPKCLHPYARP